MSTPHFWKRCLALTELTACESFRLLLSSAKWNISPQKSRGEPCWLPVDLVLCELGLCHWLPRQPGVTNPLKILVLKHYVSHALDKYKHLDEELSKFGKEKQSLLLQFSPSLAGLPALHAEHTSLAEGGPHHATANPSPGQPWECSTPPLLGWLDY